MIEGKTIGVVIATYNGSKYIKEQIESIINQTALPDLVIVSDGNSSDDTVDICCSLLKNAGFESKLLTSEKQLSVVENFEKAYKNCNCDYVFFCDQDDIWLKDKIELTVNSMMKANAVLGFTDAYVTNEVISKEQSESLWTTIGFSVKNENMVIPRGDYKFFKNLLKQNVVTGMCMCIRNDVKKHILPFSVNCLHDKWTPFIALNYGNIVAINKKEVYYRQHSNNANGISSNLFSKFKRKDLYEKNLVNRKNCMKELMKVYHDSRFKSELHDYIFFLNSRINFLKGNKTFLKLCKEINLYKKYEVNPYVSFVKDIFCCLFVKTLDGDN